MYSDNADPHLGVARRFVALYDYDPIVQSPNDNPETELTFTEGDVITITGPMDEVCCYRYMNIECLIVYSLIYSVLYIVLYTR